MTFSGISGKIALVTGAGSGIGAGSALRLSQEGATVVLVDRNQAAAQSIADALPGDTVVLAADVGSEDEMAAAFDTAVERCGAVDLVHLNAGISGPFGTFGSTTVEQFDDTVRINLRGAFLGLKNSFRVMSGRGGSIVLTASLAGLRGSPDIAPYVATKHGVVGLTKSAGVQGASQNIRVNAIAPGVIDTAMQGPLIEAMGGGASAQSVLHSASPVGRMGTTQEVGSLVAYLLSDEALFVTGSVITIDGGVSADSPIKMS